MSLKKEIVLKGTRTLHHDNTYSTERRFHFYLMANSIAVEGFIIQSNQIAFFCPAFFFPPLQMHQVLLQWLVPKLYFIYGILNFKKYVSA